MKKRTCYDCRMRRACRWAPRTETNPPFANDAAVSAFLTAVNEAYGAACDAFDPIPELSENERRLELGEAWREWLEQPSTFPTDRLLDAMGALLPEGFDIAPENKP